jgi:hypothetical protein
MFPAVPHCRYIHKAVGPIWYPECVCLRSVILYALVCSVIHVCNTYREWNSLNEDEQENITSKFHASDGKRNITLYTAPCLHVPFKLIIWLIQWNLICYLNPICPITSIAMWQWLLSVSYRYVIETHKYKQLQFCDDIKFSSRQK